jgi:hypothetical protein
MKKIVERARGVRYSRRYPRYLRVYTSRYLLALVELLNDEASDLIEMLKLQETLAELGTTLENPAESSAAGRLTRGILESVGANSAMSLAANEFNLAAERYYRTALKRRHLVEAIGFLGEDLRMLESEEIAAEGDCKAALSYCTGDRLSHKFVSRAREDVLDETASLDTLTRLINLILITEHHESAANSTRLRENDVCDTSVCGEGIR